MALRPCFGRLAVVVTSCLVTGCQAAQVRYDPVDQVRHDPAQTLATLFLLGDGGEDNQARTDVLVHLARNVATVAADGAGPPVAVVYLGDNIYEEGVRADSVSVDVEKLRDQIYALGQFPNVRGVFVPGNHDWANGQSAEDGRAAMLRQRDGIRRLSGGRDVRLLPDGGCPGPVSQRLGDSVHLVFYDSEWLLREPLDDCGTPADFYRRIRGELEENRQRRVVVLSHHPLVSGGPHGGNVAPFEHGPLVYYLSTKSGMSIQDRTSAAYSSMAARLDEAFTASGAPPLIQAAGHDHNLQVIGLPRAGGPSYQLVSGSASRSTNVRRVDGMRYASNGFGYMRVDFQGSAVRLSVYARPVDEGPVRTVFTCALVSAEGLSDCPEAPLSEGSR